MLQLAEFMAGTDFILGAQECEATVAAAPPNVCLEHFRFIEAIADFSYCRCSCVGEGGREIICQMPALPL